MIRLMGEDGDGLTLCVLYHRPMDLGFDTVGNGTLVAYDSGPVLVTDPWVVGHAYFGSWGLSHEIPKEQLEKIRLAPYVWVSHGHPDHLQWESLELLRGKTILLPDHKGARIADALRDSGHRVQVLDDRSWVRLSERIRIWNFTDKNQDAGLLVELDGSTLVVNLNDLGNSGWFPAIRKIVSQYPTAVVMAASGYGDIRGMNHWDPEGTPIPSFAQIRKETGVRIGPENARLTDALGGTHFVPFSSMHQYQRDDSEWSNAYLTSLGEFTHGYQSSQSVPLPAYIRYEVNGEISELKPQEIKRQVRSSIGFGDDWSEVLSRAESEEVTRYFENIRTLATDLDFVTVRVGGQEHGVRYSTGGVGISFEVPRGSLLTTVRHRIWEDLILGNFMRTTWHGWSVADGMAGFLPLVKYADQANVTTDKELASYMRIYKHRMGRFAMHRHNVEHALIGYAQRSGASESSIYRTGRTAYRRIVEGSSRI